ncbi:protein PilH [Chitinimonas prasina]|uniref:Protein PilH n=2 Tax=Chitinimonas TaxID=240411 RepID=A0ABQ5YDW1_9NEIS|nr:protein PilH [Chitinimonas prasina]
MPTTPEKGVKDRNQMTIKKILIVDDSPTERHFLGELLTKNGFQVMTLESGEEAVARVKDIMPDLILMDVVMPGLNGFQATRTITKDDATAHIPVIMCTSKGQETDIVWGKRQGAKGYVVKPVNPDELLKQIAALG